MPARASTGRATPSSSRGWAPDTAGCLLVLVRHGVTAHTVDKRFSGGLGGSDPGLSETGRAQVRATADWLVTLADDVDTVVASPVRRTRESAEIVAARLDRPLVVDEGLAEMEFGTWDGLTFAEVRDRYPEDLDRWLGAPDVVPGGHGESLVAVQARVLTSLDRLLVEHAGRTVVAVTHVTPIKLLVARALDAPLSSVFAMELAPASVTVLSFYADGRASMRMFNAQPGEGALTGR